MSRVVLIAANSPDVPFRDNTNLLGRALEFRRFIAGEILRSNVIWRTS